MTDRTLPAMYAQDFSRGIFGGIAEIGKRRPPSFLQGWDLYSRRSDTAAEAAYQVIKATGEYDLWFHIILHEIYGDSPVWRDIVREELYLYCTLRQWVPDGVFEIIPGLNDLDQWLHSGSLAGTRELWIATAEKFVEVYENYEE
ncbi:MAG: hypothetical protein WBP22_04190 [Candidatus Saccharimonas sp.]